MERGATGQATHSLERTWGQVGISPSMPCLPSYPGQMSTNPPINPGDPRLNGLKGWNWNPPVDPLDPPPSHGFDIGRDGSYVTALIWGHHLSACFFSFSKHQSLPHILPERAYTESSKDGVLSKPEMGPMSINLQSDWFQTFPTLSTDRPNTITSKAAGPYSTHWCIRGIQSRGPL